MPPPQRGRGYKIRSYVSGKAKDGSEYKNYSLTVPNAIAEALPKSMVFIPKMTEEGLLYEPIGHASGIDLPSWAQEHAQETKQTS